MSDCCPLCEAGTTLLYHTTAERRWLRCESCDLIHVPASDHLSAEEEKARYDTHQNIIGDPDYCAFLDRLCMPLMKEIPPESSGLDFGSGPGPALATMMTERGYSMSLYDVFYAPDTDVLNQNYDFVTCTETVEHFADPATDWGATDFRPAARRRTWRHDSDYPGSRSICRLVLHP